MFDGTHLYDAGDMPGWGTYKFDYDRYEVRSFLISSALFWLRTYHADALRVDGVSSMLYLNFGIEDPARKKYYINGGEENLGAISCCRRSRPLWAAVPRRGHYAEESSAWPLVTYPPEQGGLGFPLQVGHGLDERHAALFLRGF
jgi:1,4-alpha-glucan branching enzyme